METINYVGHQIQLTREYKPAYAGVSGFTLEVQCGSGVCLRVIDTGKARELSPGWSTRLALDLPVSPAVWAEPSTIRFGRAVALVPGRSAT